MNTARLIKFSSRKPPSVRILAWGLLVLFLLLAGLVAAYGALAKPEDRLYISILVVLCTSTALSLCLGIYAAFGRG